MCGVTQGDANAIELAKYSALHQLEAQSEDGAVKAELKAVQRDIIEFQSEDAVVLAGVKVDLVSGDDSDFTGAHQISEQTEEVVNKLKISRISRGIRYMPSRYLAEAGTETKAIMDEYDFIMESDGLFFG